jgi:hypothetical protein
MRTGRLPCARNYRWLVIAGLLLAGCGEPANVVQQPQGAGPNVAGPAPPSRDNNLQNAPAPVPPSAPRAVSEPPAPVAAVAPVRWRVEIDPSPVEPAQIQPVTLAERFPVTFAGAQGVWFPPSPQPLALVKRAGGELEVVNLLTGASLGTCKSRLNNPRHFAVSPSGKALATIVSQNGLWNFEMKGFKEDTGNIEGAQRYAVNYGEVNFLLMASDTRMVAVSRGSSQALVSVHETGSPPPVPTKFELQAHSRDEVLSVDDVAACSPGGRYLATVLTTKQGGRLVVHELTTHEPADPYKVSTRQPVGAIDLKLASGDWQYEGVAFARDGKTLAVLAGNGAQFRVGVFDVQTGSQTGMASQLESAPPAGTFRARKQDFPLRAIDCVENGQQIQGWAVYGRYLLPLNDSSLKPVFPDAGDQRDRLIVSPLAVIVAQPVDNAWQLQLQSAVQPALAAANPPAAVETSPSTAAPNSPQLMPNPALQPPAGVPQPAAVAQATPQPGAQPMVSAEELARAREFTATPLEEWKPLVDPAPKASSFTPASKIAHQFETYTKFYRGTQNRLVLASGNDDQARVFNLATGKQVGERMAYDRRQEIVALDDATERIAFVPRESGRHESIIVRKIRDLESQTIKIDDFGEVMAIYFVPAGLLVVQEHNQQCMVRLFPPGQTRARYRVEVLSFDNYHEHENHVDVSPGGKFLAVQSHRGVTLVDIEQGTIVQTVAQPFFGAKSDNTTNNNSVRFSPDGKYLAARYMFGQVQTGGNIDKLCIWDLATGELLLDRSYTISLRVRGKVLQGDVNTISWLGSEVLLAHGSLLIDRQTGAPFYLLSQEEQETVGALTEHHLLAFDDNEEMLVVLPLPREKIVAALQKARQAPSEQFPKLTQRPAGNQVPLRPAATSAMGMLQVDAAPSAPTKLGPLELSISEARPRNFWISAGDQGLAVVQRETRGNQNEHPVGTLELARALPLAPEQTASVSIYSLDTGKALHRLELPGQATLLDVSPDGSLILTGNRYSIAGDISRLDIWGPKIGRSHVLGWQPAVADASRDEMIDGAKFIDKKHVLTWDGREVSLWRLPACEQVYRRACSLEPKFSPTRKYWISPTDRIVYDSLTGEAVVQLEVAAGVTGLVSHPSFVPGGDSLVGLWNSNRRMSIARWSLDGKMQELLPLELPHSGVAWPLGDRGLMIQQFLGAQREFVIYDLLRKQVAAVHGAGGADNIHFAQPDGTYWRCELISSGPDPNRPTKAAYYLQGFGETAFAWPNQGVQQLLAAKPGSKMSARVIGDAGDMNLIGQALVDRLTAAGFVYDPNAELALTFELKQIIPAEERLRVLRIFTPILAIQDNAGKVYWLNSQRMEQPLELRQAFDAAGFIKGRTPPQYLFNREWKGEHEKTDLPPINVR